MEHLPVARQAALASCALLGLMLVGACAPSPRPPSSGDGTGNLRYYDPALACDGDGHVYVAGAERFPTHTQILVSSSERYGESWSAGFHYLNSSRDGDRGRPQLAVGGVGEVYALWEDTRHGRIELYFNRSLDAGTTWMGEDVRIDDERGAVTRVGDPALCADQRGNVYVVWRDDREGFPAYYATRSRDRGSTWRRDPVRITGVTPHRKSAPRVVCNQSGGVYAAWVEEGFRGVFFNASTQYGDAWAFDAQRLASLSSGSVRFVPDVCATETGLVVVVWSELRGGEAFIQMARSESHGTFFEPVRTLEAGGGPWYEPSAPQVECDAFRNVYVSWQALRADGSGEFIVKTSRDDARTFQETRFPRGGDTSFRRLLGQSRFDEPIPFRMRADAAGNVYFAWTMSRGGVLRVGFDRLSDYGRSWLGLSRSLDHTGYAPLTLDAPLLCVDDFGHVYLLWNEGPRMTVASSPFYGDSGWRYEQF